VEAFHHRVVAVLSTKTSIAALLPRTAIVGLAPFAGNMFSLSRVNQDRILRLGPQSFRFILLTPETTLYIGNVFVVSKNYALSFCPEPLMKDGRVHHHSVLHARRRSSISASVETQKRARDQQNHFQVLCALQHRHRWARLFLGLVTACTKRARSVFPLLLPLFRFNIVQTRRPRVEKIRPEQEQRHSFMLILLEGGKLKCGFYLVKCTK